MANHTAGPWSVDGPVDTFDVKAITAPGVRGRLLVASTKDVEIRHGMEGQNEANARLIAAAPDMLAALQAIVAYQDNHDGQSFEDAFTEVEIIAQTAIAAVAGKKVAHV